MRSLVEALARPRMQVGFTLGRWSFGLCLLREYISLYGQRYFFWKSELSRNPGDTSWMGISLFDLHEAEWFFDLVLLVSIATTALFVVGVGGRTVKVATYVFMSSLQNTNELILDGGDNFMRIAFFFLMFSGDNPRGVVGRAVHNLSLFSIVTQTCFLYFFTGLYKAMGEMWQSGVAVYYTLRTQWFTWPGVSELVYGNEYLVVAATYGTMFFELAFPFLLLNRYSRYAALVMGVAFHSGTAALMGLVGFSWAMLSVYFLLVTDDEYARLKGLVSRLTAARRQSDSDVLLFDGDCPACNRFAVFVLKRNALIRVASIKSAPGRRMLGKYGKDTERPDSMYVVSNVNGAEVLHERSSALVFLLGRLDCVAWRGIGWLIQLCPIRVADAIYRFVAARRSRVPVGECDVGDNHRFLEE